MKITVMSWNIAMGEDMDGIVQHIAELKPDILCLQEVVENHPNSKRWIPLRPILEDDSVGTYSQYDLAELIAQGITERNLDFTYDEGTYFPSIPISERHSTRHGFGDAILKKRPHPSFQDIHYISFVESMDDLSRGTERLSNRKDMAEWVRKGYLERDAEPRGVVRRKVQQVTEVLSQPIDIINTHLGPSPKFLPTEITETQRSRLIDKIKETRNIKRTILVGDFNIDPKIEEGRQFYQVIENLGLRNVDPNPVQEGTWSLWPESARSHREKYQKAMRGGRREIEPTPELEPKLLEHRLDQILVGEGIKVIDYKIYKPEASAEGQRKGKLYASDHASLVAVLEV